MKNINRWANLSQFDSCGCQTLLFKLWRLKCKNGHTSRDKMHFPNGHFWEFKRLKLRWAYVTDIQPKKTKKFNEGFDLLQFGSLRVKCQFLNLRSATFIKKKFKWCVEIEIYILKIWNPKHFPLNFGGLNAIKDRVSWCVRSHSFLSHCLSVNFSLPPSLSLCGGEGRWP